MIPKILNLQEVEQGIRESAQADASDVGWSSIYGSFAQAALIVYRVAFACARISGADGLSFKAWASVPILERNRLTWLWLEAYAHAMQDRLAQELRQQIERSAGQLRCQKCGEPDTHGDHFAATKGHLHLFVCPHGQEVSWAHDCIKDHPDVTATATTEVA